MTLLVAVVLILQSPEAPKVRLEPPDSPRALFRCEAKGITQEFFHVYTISDPSRAIPSDTPALIGIYQTYKDELTFRPKYAIDRGLTYRARVDLPGQPVSEFDFKLESLEKAAPSAVVTKVSPSAAVLPENLLKFYIEFSKPMSRGEAYRHLQLLNSDGKALKLPFLELAEELWDPRGVRFTLLLDPGRIKQELLPREEDGPIFEAGKSYTLRIDPGWEDAEGLPLAAEFRKTFKAGPPDAESPDPKRWTLEPPKAGTRDPFQARFPEPLDSALLGRVVGLTDAQGEPLAGRIEVAADQQAWLFFPKHEWRAGTYRLRVGKTLEDLAGNSVGRPFEVDLSQKQGDHSEEGYLELSWEIASKSR